MQGIDDLYARYELLREGAVELRDFAVARGGPRPPILELMAAQDPRPVLELWSVGVGDLVRAIAGRSGAEPFLVVSARVLGLACAYGVLCGAAWEDLAVAELYRRGPAAGVDDPGGLADLAERLLALPAAPPGKLFLVWAIGDAVYRSQVPVERQRPLSDIVRTATWELERHEVLRPIFG